MRFSALLSITTFLAAASASPAKTGSACTSACQNIPGISAEQALVQSFTTGKTIDGGCYCFFSAGNCKKLCQAQAERNGWPYQGNCRPYLGGAQQCDCYVPEGTPGSTSSSTKCEGKGSYKPVNTKD
ncbi:hypothetical protein BKA64DRAFT_161016 [Cadophora sp. MPI-SDFR-AT-0126]|nr:hypothetical protein BKA64DRAFT_161016 [Leotiomycetes sp. MPI-SDFR-AT-0126]